MGKEDSKLITVLLPVVDRKYLAETLISIREQTLESCYYDLVIINDGVDNDSIKKVISESYFKNNFKMIDSGRIGIVGALNLGLSECATKYIARIDQDDLMFPDRLRMQMEYLERNDQILCVGGQIQLIDSVGKKIGYSYFPKSNWIIEKSKFLSSPIAHPASMFRTSAAKSIGGYRTGLPEDWDMWIRFSEIGRLANLKHNVIKYRVHEDQLSKTMMYKVNNAREAVEISSKLRQMKMRDIPEFGEDQSTWRTKHRGLLKIRKRHTSLAIWKIFKMFNNYCLCFQNLFELRN